MIGESPLMTASNIENGIPVGSLTMNRGRLELSYSVHWIGFSKALIEISKDSKLLINSYESLHVAYQRLETMVTFFQTLGKNPLRIYDDIFGGINASTIGRNLQCSDRWEPRGSNG